MSVADGALDILDNLHELSGASTTVEFRVKELSDRLGYSEVLLLRELEYLIGQGLVRKSKHPSGGYLLTRMGIKTVDNPEASNLPQREGPPIDVFISHSSRDRDLAATVVDVLRKSMNLESRRIRGTSVDGHWVGLSN